MLTSPGVIYLWEVPVAAAIAMAAAAAIGVTAVAPVAAASPDGPPIAKSRTVTIAALVAASIVLGTNIVAELFSVVSIGRSALELFDGEPLRLLPGPGQLLFAGAAGAALMSGAGLPPISTLRDRVARGRMGSLRGWTCLLYTSDAADERSSVDIGGRRLIKKKTRVHRNRGMNQYANNTETETD